MTEIRRRGLGRGLEALIPLPSEGGDTSVPQMIAVDQVKPSQQQVRRHFDPDALRELSDSIRIHGLLQPILVRRLTDGYELLAGERRWRAARMAGVERVPALVRAAEEAPTRLVLGLTENLQRENLDPIEEAHGLRLLCDEFGLTQDEVAVRLGRNRVSINQALRLLTAAPAVQSAVSSGAISAGHARALAGLPQHREQEQGLKVIVARKLSVRQAENWVGAYKPARPRRNAPQVDSVLEDLAAGIEESVGLPVAITGTRAKGRVTLEFRSPAELEEIRRRLS